MSPPDETSLRAAFDKAGQSHVFAHWDKCSADEQKALLAQLSEIDLSSVTSVFTRSMLDHEAGSSSKGDIEPVAADADVSNPEQSDTWHKAGLTAAANGTLAVVLLAGGQGTRLGSSAPKGMYDIGLPSGRTLFQLQCERLVKLQEDAEELMRGEGKGKGESSEPGNPKVRVPLYVMTSPFTHAVTKTYFEKNNHFGLDEAYVTFFQQGWLPCFSEGDDPERNGKILMKSKSEVSTAPDGNGGVYKALMVNGCIADMEKKGIKHIYAYCVDNAAVKVGDPTFVGFNISHNFEAGAKVIQKAYAEEPVGVFIKRNNKVQVIEYSEMPGELNLATDKNGNLKFNCANIVLHYYGIEFLRKCCDAEGLVQKTLSYHVARKKIPVLSDDGLMTQTPEKNNGVKLEAFIFDVYAFAENVGFLNGERSHDFAPVKNKEGSRKDSPDTARMILSSLHRRWIEKAGGKIVGEGPVEVSPALSFDGKGLENFANGKYFAANQSIETDVWVERKMIGNEKKRKGEVVEDDRAKKK